MAQNTASEDLVFLIEQAAATYSVADIFTALAIVMARAGTLELAMEAASIGDRLVAPTVVHLSRWARP
jgi:hypothetical protein